MRQLFRRLAHKTGLLHAPSDPARSATRPLRVLLVGSIVLPVTLYAVAAAISYQQHFDDARDRLRRNLAIVHEHAQKVFETFEFASRYLDEMTGNATDEQIRAERGVLFRAAARDDDVDAAVARSLDRRRRRLSAGVRHGVSDAADRPFGPRLFQGPSRQSGERPLRHRGAGGSRRQHPLLRDQPQARDQRQVRRRHHRFDRAGIFQRVLFPASAARDRDAATRRRRLSGPLSQFPGRVAAAASGRAVSDRDQDPAAGRIHHGDDPDRRPRANFRLPAAGEAARALRHGRRRGRRRHARLDARHGEPSDLRPAGDARAGQPRHHRASPHRAPAAGGEPARIDRAGAAPGAEDGSGRPAVGRHRARLQQHAHRDPRQYRHGLAPHRR